MGDIDQLRGPLADGLGIQVSHAVFGDHITDVVAGGDHPRALVEHGHDAADDLAVFEVVVLGRAMIGTPPLEREAP